MSVTNHIDESNVACIKIKKYVQRTVQQRNNNNDEHTVGSLPDVTFRNILCTIFCTTPGMDRRSIGMIGNAYLRDGNQLHYNIFGPGHGINANEWLQTMTTMLPCHQELRGNKDSIINNGLLTILVSIINYYYLDSSAGDHKQLATGLAAVVLLCFGKASHSKTIIAEAYGINDATTIDQHHTNITYLGRSILNILYVWMETDVLNNELIRRLPPAFRQLLHAIQTNKTGVTTVGDAPYNGMELANILVNNLRETRNTPNSNTTFESLAITWYRDFFINHETADDETGVTNGIFEAFGIPVAMFEMDEEYLG